MHDRSVAGNDQVEVPHDCRRVHEGPRRLVPVRVEFYGGAAAAPVGKLLAAESLLQVIEANPRKVSEPAEMPQWNRTLPVADILRVPFPRDTHLEIVVAGQ